METKMETKKQPAVGQGHMDPNKSKPGQQQQNRDPKKAKSWFPMMYSENALKYLYSRLSRWGKVPNFTQARLEKDIEANAADRQMKVYSLTPEFLAKPEVVDILKDCIHSNIVFTRMKTHNNSVTELRGLLTLEFALASDVAMAMKMLKTLDPNLKVCFGDESDISRKRYMLNWHRISTGQEGLKDDDQQPVILIPFVPKTIDLQNMWDLFPDAKDVILVRSDRHDSYAYIFFNNYSSIHVSFARLNTKEPSKPEMRSMSAVPLKKWQFFLGLQGAQDMPVNDATAYDDIPQKLLNSGGYEMIEELTRLLGNYGVQDQAGPSNQPPGNERRPRRPAPPGGHQYGQEAEHDSYGIHDQAIPSNQTARDERRPRMPVVPPHGTQYEQDAEQFGYDEYGGPQQQHGGPQKQHGGPQQQHGGPQKQHGGPQQPYGGHQQQHGGHPQQHGGGIKPLLEVTSTSLLGDHPLQFAKPSLLGDHPLEAGWQDPHDAGWQDPHDAGWQDPSFGLPQAGETQVKKKRKKRRKSSLPEAGQKMLGVQPVGDASVAMRSVSGAAQMPNEPKRRREEPMNFANYSSALYGGTDQQAHDYQDHGMYDHQPTELADASPDHMAQGYGGFVQQGPRGIDHGRTLPNKPTGGVPNVAGENQSTPRQGQPTPRQGQPKPRPGQDQPRGDNAGPSKPAAKMKPANTGGHAGPSGNTGQARPESKIFNSMEFINRIMQVSEDFKQAITHLHSEGAVKEQAPNTGPYGGDGYM